MIQFTDTLSVRKLIESDIKGKKKGEVSQVLYSECLYKETYILPNRKRIVHEVPWDVPGRKNNKCFSITEILPKKGNER